MIYLIPVISIIGVFVAVVALAAMSAQTKQKLAQQRTEVQLKLIERFGSAPEFVTFVQSPEGKQFLGDAPRVVQTRAVAGIRTGIVLNFLGVAFMFLAWTQNERAFYIPAMILLGLGLGFVVSSLVSMKLGQQINNP